MKLKLLHEFELEVDDTILKGVLKDLTKSEVKAIEALSPKKELKRIKKLNRKDKLTKKEQLELDDLYYIVDEFDIETSYQARLEQSILGKQKNDILNIADIYGYKRVFETIIEDISERKEGN